MWLVQEIDFHNWKKRPNEEHHLFISKEKAMEFFSERMKEDTSLSEEQWKSQLDGVGRVLYDHGPYFTTYAIYEIKTEEAEDYVKEEN